jgi:hypothetical protein
MLMRTRTLITVLIALCHPVCAWADEPFRFPAAKHGKGELKYINDVPVLLLAGTPEEIGEQMGVLGLKPASGAVPIFKDVLKQHRLDLIMPLLVQFGKAQLAKYPDTYRREFEAMAKASGIDRDLLIIANTFNELRHLAGCSGLMLDASRSRTGSPLMGRNWDFPPVPGMHTYSLVVVYRPQGKRAFAVVSFPGQVASGCLMSAMNADGVAIGGNFIGGSADGAPQVDWQKTPSSVIARRLLEECSDLAAVEKLLRADRQAERHSLVACDKGGGAVFEITPKNLVVRRGQDGLCVGTNHFVSRELGVPTECRRLAILNEASRKEKLSVAEVAKMMHAANQGPWTVHSMVFEPGPLRLHVAFGDGKRPASAGTLKEIDLRPLLQP